MVAVLLLAAALGIQNLNADGIWHDEQRSMYYAGARHYGPVTPIETATRMIENGSGQMPLYFVLLSGWGTLVGWTPFAARAMSLLFGLLTVAVFYQAGRVLHSPSVGLMTAAVAATTAYYQTYLHELRPYALMILLMAVSVLLYWQMRQHPNRIATVLFPLALAALLYTQPFAVPGVVALGLYHLIAAPKNRQWWQLLGLFVVGGLLFLPWGLLTLRVVSQFADNNAAESLSDNTNLTLLRNLIYGFSNGTYLLALVMLLPSVALWRHPAVRYAWFLLTAAVVVLLGINLFVPILVARYFLILWAVLPILAGFSLWVLAQRWRAAAALGLAAWMLSGAYNSLNLRYVDTLYGAEAVSAFRLHLPLPDMANTLAEQAADGDAVAVHLAYQRWAMELVYDFYLYDLPGRFVVIDSLKDDGSRDLNPRLARTFIADANRLWVVTEPQHTNAVLTDFSAIMDDRGYAPCATPFDTDTLRLTLYARRALYCNLTGETVSTFGPQVTLTGLETEPQGNTLNVHTTWAVDPALWSPDYTISFFLLDDAGEVASQAESTLMPGPLGHRAFYLPTESLPDGRYNLVGTVYNWNTGERLPPGLNPDANGLADFGTVNIAQE